MPGRRKRITPQHRARLLAMAPRGGASTMAKWGTEHFVELGRKGGAATREKWASRAPESTLRECKVRFLPYQEEALRWEARRRKISVAELIRSFVDQCLFSAK